MHSLMTHRKKYNDKRTNNIEIGQRVTEMQTL